MRWQRVARLVVAVVGLAFAVALFAYSRQRATRTTPLPTGITDKNATSERIGVTTIRWKTAENKEEIQITAAVETDYADGHTRFKNAVVTTTRDGHKFEMSADVIETKGKAATADDPGEVTLNGHIVVKTDDGLDLRTEAATYDSGKGLATIPGKVTFTRGRMSGDGTGATYERERNTLSLLDQAHVAQAADEKGGGAVDATAKTIVLARSDKQMTLTENAKIVRSDQTLAADSIVVHFTNDENGVQLIEMRGRSSVVPAPDAKNSPNMSADQINLDFQPDGATLRHASLMQRAQLIQTGDHGQQTIHASTIDLVTAPDGRTLTNLDAKDKVEVVLPPTADAPGRTITAPSLVASGDEKVGLKAALFEGDVVFLEAQPAGKGQPKIDRTGRSKRLLLDLNGQLGAIQKAEFRENVTFKDDQLTASSDVANYDEVKGTMLLTPAKNTAKAPQVDDGTVRVDAASILIAMDTHDLQAKENVHMRMTQSKTAGGNTHAPALFDDNQPVRGVGAQLTYVSKSKSATFLGPKARVYQDDGSYITGDRIELEQETGNLKATGAAKSSFVLETKSATTGAKGDTKKAAPTIGDANELVYKDAERKAVYSGDATKLASLVGPDGTIKAQTIVLTLQQEQRALQTLEATDSVWSTFDDGRETIAAHLTYDATTEVYALSGNPMHFKSIDNKENQKNCSHETLTEMTYNRTTHATHVPASPGRPLRPTEPIACTASLKEVVKK